MDRDLKQRYYVRVGWAIQASGDEGKEEIFCEKGEDGLKVQQQKQEQDIVHMKDWRVGRVKDNAKVLGLGNRIDSIVRELGKGNIFDL